MISFVSLFFASVFVGAGALLLFTAWRGLALPRRFGFRPPARVADVEAGPAFVEGLLECDDPDAPPRVIEVALTERRPGQSSAAPPARVVDLQARIEGGRARLVEGSAAIDLDLRDVELLGGVVRSSYQHPSKLDPALATALGLRAGPAGRFVCDRHPDFPIHFVHVVERSLTPGRPLVARGTVVVVEDPYRSNPGRVLRGDPRLVVFQPGSGARYADVGAARRAFVAALVGLVLVGQGALLIALDIASF